MTARQLRPTLVLLALVAGGAVLLHDVTRASEAPKPPATQESAAAKELREFPPQPQVPVLTPEQELKTFQLPDGYRMELVLAEPNIAEPVACVFDGNGRMYVPEMRTYMQDIDGTAEIARRGRVSRHESSRGDGVFDRHTVFADHLLLPRMVLPLEAGRVLINETDTNDVLAWKDKNGDGVADEWELWFDGGKRGGNLEHQQSGLVWGMDNWIYQSVNAWRLRANGNEVIQEKTPGNGGQWGLAQDDYGKMWFSNGGAEKGPVKYQVPIIYGGFDAPNQATPDYPEVWPLVGLADYQGGPMRVRQSDKTLNHFTATCGQAIFRGDRLPADLRGDLLFGEPVGRLIRRTKVENQEGLTFLRNAYDHSEFIRSSDPNFRPVNMTTGPDGCLYIVDMYRGIIQEGNWVREGSYLRKVVKQYGLQNNTGHGRIWRLVHKDFKPGPQPHMLQETPAQLVQHLDHPNGWWRDTAQMLLVLRGDKSVVPALTAMARTHKNPLARIHAIWTLEGLGALDAALVREKLKDADAHVRIAAIRAGEPLMKKGDEPLAADVRALAKDADPNVVIQVLCTAKLLKWPDYNKFAQLTVLATQASGVRAIGALLLNDGNDIEERLYSKEEVAQLRKGREIYQELCFACHGYTGTGMPMDGAAPGATIAPPLVGSRDVLDHGDTAVRILLKGLSGPVVGKDYTAQMVPMNGNDDAWIAAAASYVRNAFGNHAAMVTAKDVARLRAETFKREAPYTLDELHALLPRALANQKEWKLTASHNAADLKLAVDGNFETRWTSKAPLAPGMWVQIELPTETTIAALWLDTTKSTHDYPREYKVQTSPDGLNWNGKPIAQGKGTAGVMEIRFAAPVRTKYLRLTQTGKLRQGEGTFWSIHELRLLEPPATPTQAASE
jgi:mono/diheme cytochrome c family protein/glucose/arabinose dehydrogenase